MVQWELIQPLTDKGIFAKFLAEKGEGVHHIAVAAANFARSQALLGAAPSSKIRFGSIQCRIARWSWRRSGKQLEYRRAETRTLLWLRAWGNNLSSPTAAHATKRSFGQCGPKQSLGPRELPSVRQA
jgi:hypothetical protein